MGSVGLSQLIDVLASVMAGALISAGIARAYIARSLKDLETALDLCHDIKIEVAKIQVEVRGLSKLTDRVAEHDRLLYSYINSHESKGEHKHR